MPRGNFWSGLLQVSIPAVRLRVDTSHPLIELGLFLLDQLELQVRTVGGGRVDWRQQGHARTRGEEERAEGVGTERGVTPLHEV